QRAADSARRKEGQHGHQNGASSAVDDDIVSTAYKYFRVDAARTDCDDDFIIRSYRVQIEASPKQKEAASSWLAVIGRHRESQKILDICTETTSNGPMDFKEALRFIEAQESWPPENMVALAQSLNVSVYFSSIPFLLDSPYYPIFFPPHNDGLSNAIFF